MDRHMRIYWYSNYYYWLDRFFFTRHSSPNRCGRWSFELSLSHFYFNLTTQSNNKNVFSIRIAHWIWFSFTFFFFFFFLFYSYSNFRPVLHNQSRFQCRAKLRNLQFTPVWRWISILLTSSFSSFVVVFVIGLT